MIIIREGGCVRGPGGALDRSYPEGAFELVAPFLICPLEHQTHPTPWWVVPAPFTNLNVGKCSNGQDSSCGRRSIREIYVESMTGYHTR